MNLGGLVRVGAVMEDTPFLGPTNDTIALMRPGWTLPCKPTFVAFTRVSAQLGANQVV